MKKTSSVLHQSTHCFLTTSFKSPFKHSFIHTLQFIPLFILRRHRDSGNINQLLINFQYFNKYSMSDFIPLRPFLAAVQPAI